MIGLLIAIATATPAIGEADPADRARVTRARAPARAVVLPARRPQLWLPPTPAQAPRSLSFGRVLRRDPAVPQVPWFWEALRSRVYSAMPHVQKRNFTMTVSPVVVTGTDDTVPGLGISGDF